MYSSRQNVLICYVLANFVVVSSSLSCWTMELDGEYGSTHYVIADSVFGQVQQYGSCDDECSQEVCLSDGCYLISLSAADDESALAWSFADGYLSSEENGFYGPSTFCLENGTLSSESTAEELAALSWTQMFSTTQNIVSVESYDDLTDTLLSLADDDYAIRIDADIALLSGIEINGKNATIFGTGTLDQGRATTMLQLSNGARLELSGGLTLSGNLTSKTTEDIITIDTGSWLVLMNCQVKRFDLSTGAVFSVQGGTLELVHTTIHHLVTKAGAFAVSDDGHIRVIGGSIYSNKATETVAVFALDCGHIEMQDTTLRNNRILVEATAAADDDDEDDEEDTDEGATIFGGPTSTVACARIVTARNVTISSNTGGPVFFIGDSITWTAVATSTLESNRATNGAILYTDHTGRDTIFMSDLYIANNKANDTGGVAVFDSSSTTLYGSGIVTFEGNEATEGAVFFVELDVEVYLEIEMRAYNNYAREWGSVLHVEEESFLYAISKPIIAAGNSAGNDYGIFMRIEASGSVEISNLVVDFDPRANVVEAQTDTYLHLSNAIFRGSEKSATPFSPTSTFDLSQATVVIENCVFENITGIDMLVETYKTTISLSNVTVDTMEAVQTGFYFQTSTVATLQNVSFVNTDAEFGAIELLAADADLTACSFTNCSSTTSAAALFLNYQGYAYIEDCAFVSNQGLSGGAIAIASYGSLVSRGGNSYFDNTASTDGGCIYLDTSAELELSSDVFSGNSAPNGGGGAIFENTDEDDTAKAIETYCTSNTSVLFSSNSAAYGNDCASTEIDIELVWNSSSGLQESGKDLDPPIQVYPIDVLNQRIITSSGGIVRVSLNGTSDEILLTGSSEFAIVDGLASTDGLEILASPGVDVGLAVTTFMTDGDVLLSYISIPIATCGEGEVEVDKECIECDADSYYIDGECKDCPNGFVCGDGVDISERLIESLQMDTGYMRQSRTSENPILCDGGRSNPACKKKTDRVGCSKRSHANGPTCKTCARTHYRSGYRCVRCGKTTFLYSLQILFWFIVFSFLFIALARMQASSHSHIQINQITRVRAKLRAKWRVAYVTLQILISLKDVLDIRWPTSYSKLLDVFSVLHIHLPFDCVDSNHRYNMYSDLVALTLGPLLVCFFAGCYFHLQAIFRYRDQQIAARGSEAVSDPNDDDRSIQKEIGAGAPSAPDAVNSREDITFTPIATKKSEEEHQTNTNGLIVTPAPTLAVSLSSRQWHLPLKHDVFIDAPTTSSDHENKHFSKARGATLSVFILVCFLTYPISSSTIIKMFAAEEYDDPSGGSDSTVKYLQYDLGLRYDVSRHKAWLVYASICIVTHIIGIPAIFFLLLYQKREKIDPFLPDKSRPRLDQGDLRASKKRVDAAVAYRANITDIKHLDLLFAVYQPILWWFECIECIRRFLLTGGLVVLAKRNNVKALWSVALALCSLKLYQSLLPFNSVSDNILAVTLQWVLVIANICTFCLATKTLQGNPSIAVILVTLVLGAVVITLWLIYKDIKRERKAINLVLDSLRDLEHTLVHTASDLEHSHRYLYPHLPAVETSKSWLRRVPK